MSPSAVLCLMLAVAVSSSVPASAASNSSSVAPTPALPSTAVVAPSSHAAMVNASSPHHAMSSSLHVTNASSSTAAMSSSAAPFTTKAPYVPSSAEFSFPEKSKMACVTINGSVTFEVEYYTKEDNKTTKTAKIDLTKVNATVTGKCPDEKLVNTTSRISVAWELANTMTLDFKFGAHGQWFLSEVTFKVDTTKSKHFVNASKPSYSAHKKFNESENGAYRASGNHSYLCHTDSKLELGNMIVADFKHIQIQPFNMTKGSDFNNAYMCPGDNSSTKPNSLVPIIVGCALAGLIVIVLIAYLVGRRKSSRGYQQV